MPEEVGTQTTPSDTPSAGDSLFGNASAGTTDPVAVEQGSQAQTTESPQDSANAAAQTPEEEASPSEQPAKDAGNETSQTTDLKVVVSIKGSRGTIGVQQPSSDPHIETFDGLDESGLTEEVPTVIQRARARWEENPKHPVYERPAPPAKSRKRRGQGTAKDADATAKTEQQETLKLF